jgi:hypothetical protein
MKKGVEIELNNNGTDKKKHKISPFLVCWHALEHRDGTTVHGKREIQGLLWSESVAFMMNHRKSSGNCVQ